MTSPLDEYAPTCALAPVQGIGPGWYLVAANGIVEAGPFRTAEDAEAYASACDETGGGVNPLPWVPDWSDRGLLVGSRRRRRRA